MEELIIYGSDSNTKNIGSESIITACELNSGIHISSFKQSASPRNGIDCTQDLIIACQSQQTLLHVYIHDKESINQKIVVPERLSCIKVSPSGTWLIGGTFTGRLLIWELATGSLIFAADAHYQEITCLDFTQDEAFLFTGSKDSRIYGWSMVEFAIISSSDQEDNMIRPQIEWTDHSLEITSMQIGYGKWNECRVFTTSLDQTLRCWDVASNQLLTTYVLPDKIASLTVDPLERVVYVGLNNGDIEMVSMFQTNPVTGLIEAVGGGKRVITLEFNSSDYTSGLLKHHHIAVTALTLSLDGTLLVSGDESGQVFVWDITSKQVVRKLKQHKESISRIQIISRNKRDPVLVAKNKKNPQAYMLPQLKRIPEQNRMNDIWVQVPDKSGLRSARSSPGFNYEQVEIAKMEINEFMSDTESGLQLKMQQLQADYDKLHGYYGELQQVHQELWKMYTSKSK